MIINSNSIKISFNKKNTKYNNNTTTNLILDQILGGGSVVTSGGSRTQSDSIVSILDFMDNMSLAENYNETLFYYDTESVYFNMYDAYNAFAEQSDKAKTHHNMISGASKAVSTQSSIEEKSSSNKNYIKLVQDEFSNLMTESSSESGVVSNRKNDVSFFIPNNNFTYLSTTDNTSSFIKFVEYNYFSVCLNHETLQFKRGMPITVRNSTSGRNSNTPGDVSLNDLSCNCIHFKPYCSKCCPCAKKLLVSCNHDPLVDNFISEGDYSNGDPIFYYRKFFYNNEHYNYITMDNVYGPVIISFMKNIQLSPNSSSNIHITDSLLNEKRSSCIDFCRIIIRTVSNTVLRATVAIAQNANGSESKSLQFFRALMCCAPSLKLSKFYKVSDYKLIQDSLLNLDEMLINRKHKIGVLLCLHNQSSDTQMYSNDTTTPDLENFMDLLAEKVDLANFTGFTGGLATGSQCVGQHSYYTKFREHEIMFHVSTMLSHNSSDPQNIYVKRHIGNDKVVIIFQDDCTVPFDVSKFRSKFQHCFFIVRPNKKDQNDVLYDICVCISKDVPSHGIFMVNYSLRPSKEFSYFFLNLLITANDAVNQCSKLTNMIERTRYEAMNKIVKQFSKKASSVKKPGIIEKPYFQYGNNIKNMSIFDEFIYNQFPGGLSVLVNVHGRNGELIPYNIVISSKTIFLLPVDNIKPDYHIPNCRVHGWEVSESKIIRLYVGYIHYIDFSVSFSVDKNILTVLKALLCCTKGSLIKQIIWGDNKPNLSSVITLGSNGIIKSINSNYIDYFPYFDCIGDSIFDINGSIKLPFSAVVANEYIQTVPIMNFKILPNKNSQMSRDNNENISKIYRCHSLKSFLKNADNSNKASQYFTSKSVPST